MFLVVWGLGGLVVLLFVLMYGRTKRRPYRLSFERRGRQAAVPSAPECVVVCNLSWDSRLCCYFLMTFTTVVSPLLLRRTRYTPFAQPSMFMVCGMVASRVSEYFVAPSGPVICMSAVPLQVLERFTLSVFSTMQQEISVRLVQL